VRQCIEKGARSFFLGGGNKKERNIIEVLERQ